MKRGQEFHHNESTISYAHKIRVLSTGNYGECSKDAAFFFPIFDNSAVTGSGQFRLSTADMFSGKPTVSHSISAQGESWLQYVHTAATQRPALHQ